MRFQTQEGACGAAAVVNVARCFGRRIAERNVRPVAGTTEDGTPEGGILRALAAVGLSGTPFSSPDFRLALAAIADTPAILCVQNSGHWIVVAGRTDGGRRWVVIDSSRTKANVRENGVAVWDRRALRRAWFCSRSGVFYGVLVSRRAG